METEGGEMRRKQSTQKPQYEQRNREAKNLRMVNTGVLMEDS